MRLSPSPRVREPPPELHRPVRAPARAGSIRTAEYIQVRRRPQAPEWGRVRL